MARHDRSFEPESRLGSAQWCAVAIGWPFDKFRRERAWLEENAGFPKEDPLLHGTVKAAVDKWIAGRAPMAQAMPGQKTGGINHAKL